MVFFNKKREDSDDFLNAMPSAPSYGGNEETQDMPQERPNSQVFSPELSSIKREVSKPIPQFKAPMMNQSLIPKRASEPMHLMPSKPIFVKIDGYKEALEAIQNIKGLTSQAEETLDQLTKIRAEEDRELNKWHSDIEKIKERLLVIDRKLFEQ